MGVDWVLVNQSLEDIRENSKYLLEHFGENEDEDNLRKCLINIDIENIREEVMKCSLRKK